MKSSARHADAYHIIIRPGLAKFEVWFKSMKPEDNILRGVKWSNGVVMSTEGN